MLGESSIRAGSGVDVSDEGAMGNNSGGEEEAAAGSSSQFGGAMTSRWPREETLALIKIRSEMDVSFRDSSAKGPLWEEVSRKLAELGYRRSGKKCREKFENVYKYHKRTKEGRPGAAASAAAAFPIPGAKSKTYRFFDQLEALESSPPAAVAASLVSLPTVVQQFPFPGTVYSAPPQSQQPSNHFSAPNVLPMENPSYLPGVVSADSTSSSTYSDQDLRRQRGDGENEREEKIEKRKRWKRKRKKSEWMEMFERLMGEVARKQEELQKNLFEVIERRERERLVREEAWRAQEAARIDRECEMLARDRSAAAAKDNAVIAFLQRITEQQQKSTLPRENSRDGDNNLAGNGRNLSPLQQAVMQFSQSLPLAVKGTTKPVGVGINVVELERAEVNGEKNSASSSRWPRAEVEALIKLRTNSHANYGENATKGPLWEEISSAMKKLGYNRNPKRCKEKWENINKYFKKVKESNKKRKEDSKTCPYFDLLDEIYNQKIGKNNDDDGNFFMSFRSPDGNNNNNGCSLSASTPPLMVTPENQWPPLDPPHPTSDQDFEGGGETDGEFDDGDDREGDGEKQFEVVTSKV